MNRTLKTSLSREITARGVYNGSILLSIKDVGTGDMMHVQLNSEERQKMIALLADGFIPGPKTGDIVRWTPRKGSGGYVAEKGSLAQVVDVDDLYIKVEWLDSRAGTQMDGQYIPEDFVVVTATDLTVEDRDAVAQRLFKSRGFAL